MSGHSSSSASFRWACLLFALAVLIITAQMFRYEHLRFSEATTPASEVVWDRWLHRVCYIGLANDVTACWGVTLRFVRYR